MILEEEIWRLQEENEKKEETINELRVGEERRKALERELSLRQEEVTQLKKDQVLLEQKVQQLSGRKHSFLAFQMMLLFSIQRYSYQRTGGMTCITFWSFRTR